MWFLNRCVKADFAHLYVQQEAIYAVWLVRAPPHLTLSVCHSNDFFRIINS